MGFNGSTTTQSLPIANYQPTYQDRYEVLPHLLLAYLCLTGCGPQSPDALIKEQISIINETADTVESADSLDDAKASMDKLKERGEAVTAKPEALDLSDSEKAELMQRHQADSCAFKKP